MVSKNDNGGSPWGCISASIFALLLKPAMGLVWGFGIFSFGSAMLLLLGLIIGGPGAMPPLSEAPLFYFFGIGTWILYIVGLVYLVKTLREGKPKNQNIPLENQPKTQNLANPTYSHLFSESENTQHDYEIGDCVRHERFGEGVVLKVRKDSFSANKHATVTVQFRNEEGTRDLIPKYAPMEKITVYYTLK